MSVPSENHQTRGSGLAPWPARLTAPPPRLADFGYTSDMFERDTVIHGKISLFMYAYITFSAWAHINTNTRSQELVV